MKEKKTLGAIQNVERKAGIKIDDEKVIYYC